MKIYNLRKNFSAIISENNLQLKGKLAFKTVETDWVHTPEPVIVPISLQSSFHDGMVGELKMQALVSIIKENVQGPVTLLLADTAHKQVDALGQIDTKKSAANLLARFQKYFHPCQIHFWGAYIEEDASYASRLHKITYQYETDLVFRSYVEADAEATYTVSRMNDFRDKDLFMKNARADILEQCACILVLADKGYKFQFYPGRQYGAVQYVNKTLLPSQKQIKLIDVFLTVEKKSLLDLALR